MNFTFENQGTNTFMVYQVGLTDEIDSMSLGMITNNKILGLAPTVFFQQDNTKFFKYNVSSKITAEQFLMGTVTKKRLIGVFSGIINAMISAEEYMIDANSLCLDLKYIFTDVSTCDTVMICLPIINPLQQNTDLKTFFKNIVFSTQFDQTENCDYIAKLINYLNSASVFSLYDFKEVLDTIENGAKPQPAPQVQQQAVVQAHPTPQVQQQIGASQPVVQQPTPQVKPQASVQPTVPQQVVPAKPVVPQSTVQPAKPSATPNPGFAIPGKSAPQAGKDETNAATPAANEKEISFMYLMQHYNKENAAAYKAQQEAKKAAKAAGASAKEDKKKNKKEKAQKNTVSNMPGRPPVPNGQPNPGFAIPGQAPQPVTSQPAGDYAAPVQKPVAQPTPQLAVQQLVPQEQPQVPVQPVQPQPTANFGETTVLSSAGIGETTVLGATPMAMEMNPYLIRTKNNERIVLDKPNFRIGKEKSFVDYFIGDNTAISRSHANIITRDGEYFVMDTNSTNHTYVDGQMIQSNVEVKIAHGTKIKLANEDFEFKIY